MPGPVTAKHYPNPARGCNPAGPASPKPNPMPPPESFA